LPIEPVEPRIASFFIELAINFNHTSILLETRLVVNWLKLYIYFEIFAYEVKYLAAYRRLKPVSLKRRAVEFETRPYNMGYGYLEPFANIVLISIRS
jgi:hypothetical protein